MHTAGAVNPIATRARSVCPVSSGIAVADGGKRKCSASPTRPCHHRREQRHLVVGAASCPGGTTAARPAQWQGRLWRGDQGRRPLQLLRPRHGAPGLLVSHRSQGLGAVGEAPADVRQAAAAVLAEILRRGTYALA